MSTTGKARHEQPHYAQMTVAQIRDNPGSDAVQVIFLESARFYRLLRDNPARGEALKKLQDALAKGHPVKVALPSIDSDIIQDVT